MISQMLSKSSAPHGRITSCTPFFLPSTQDGRLPRCCPNSPVTRLPGRRILAQGKFPIGSFFCRFSGKPVLRFPDPKAGGIMAARAFADPDLTPDNFNSFSKQEIDADTAAKGLAQLEPIPPPRTTAPMDLATVIGADAAGKIKNSGQIVFHTVGDTGGIHKPDFQFAVADAMAADIKN